MVSCYDILSREGIEKPKLAPFLNEIEEKERRIEEFLGHIGNARAKIQEVMRA